jgi:cephalosporin hydroxylase
MLYDKWRIVFDFHRLYYERGIHANRSDGIHRHTYYHGIETHKCPLDLWIYQELLFEIKPQLVIELGTYMGGTALFIAHQLDALGKGTVLTVDMCELPRRRHPRIGYISGKTTDSHVVSRIHDAAQSIDGPVVVVHDADHRCDQVLVDLEIYAPLVTPESFLVIEDTNINGNPVLVDWGPGPREAVEVFLAVNPDFECDPSREKFLMTYNPGGYLRRRGGGGNGNGREAARCGSVSSSNAVTTRSSTPIGAGRSELKIELGGGNRARGEGWLNVDVIESADVTHDLNSVPWPFADDSVDAVYSSHCLEHLHSMNQVFVEICRVCRVGARVELRLPHPASHMAMVESHRHVFSPVAAINMDKYFPELYWTAEKRLRLAGISYHPTFLLEEARSELPFLAGLTDESVMKWIPGTCHECRYDYTVERT